MKWLFASIVSALLYFYFAYPINAYSSVSTNSNSGCIGVLKAGEGCFIYKVEAGNFSIPVYYYLPNKLQANTNVLFAMNGRPRRGRGRRGRSTGQPGAGSSPDLPGRRR